MPLLTYARLNDRHPYEVYLLALTLASTVPASLGLAPAPASIRVQLDPTAAWIWAASLSVGAAVALVGLAWKRPRQALLSVTALLLEQVGLTIVGAASFRQAWKIQRVLRLLREQAASR